MLFPLLLLAASCTTVGGAGSCVAVRLTEAEIAALSDQAVTDTLVSNELCAANGGAEPNA